MCTPMFKYLHVSVGTFWGPEEDTKSSGTGVTGGREPPNMGARTQTHVLEKVHVLNH